MKKEIPLYLFICKKIEDDIYNGKLKLGDPLPSEPKISKQMGASRNSVRKALRLLQENNLIFCSHGKNAQVIFDSRLPEHRGAYEKRFENRRHGISDIYRMLSILLPSITTYGVSRCSREDYRTLYEMAENLDSANPIEMFAFHCRFVRNILRRTDNPFVIELFEQLCDFVRIDSIHSSFTGHTLHEGLSEKDIKGWYKELLDYAAKQNFKHFHHLLLQGLNEISKRFDAVHIANAPAPAEAEHFNWFIDNAPTPLYLRIASDIMWESEKSGNVAGDFLPSESELRRTYSVSPVTVRKALSILNSLGLTRTFNGKGTQIVFERPHSQEVLGQLDEYLSSLQILRYSCKAIAFDAFKSMTEEDKKYILNFLESRRYSRGVTTVLTDTLITSIQSPAMQNIYEHLKIKLAYGVILKTFVSNDDYDRVDRLLYGDMDKLAKAVTNNDTALLGKIIENTYRHTYEYSENKLKLLYSEQPDEIKEKTS
ncbi:GntR family transcriptional regulator [Eubacterium sp. 1001713B170207_170306_E7]|uniref:GntR family transcriptional regulator n=1 Tax=Eubacterium sp. 1001713B170207_170306_E7 TaxID=2787097 RepID=UPI00189753B7|nr:GntR family transcriptional regulator [Eubacterium sp. 1001713B170207_170306_E7]